MKSVTIFIPNYNSGDCIKLAVESIRRYTSYPYRLVVRDDCTQSEYYDDIAYLQECEAKGWLTLEQNARNLMHGATLDILLDNCTSDLAMIMDCDVQILSPGWLEAMVHAQEKTGAAVVGDLTTFPDNTVIDSWFFMVDMKTYPQWKASTWAVTKKPYWTPAPEHVNDYYATGAMVVNNLLGQKRVIEPIPKSIKYQHFIHMSMLSMPQSGPEWSIRQGRYAVVQAELKKLRAGA